MLPHFTVKDKKHKLCEACKVQVEAGRPVREDFLHFLPWFLTDNPGLKCAKGYVIAILKQLHLKCVKCMFYTSDFWGVSM